ncbi:MAG: LUD domain-containing protein, partial [Promethearchaeota archaeon]
MSDIDKGQELYEYVKQKIGKIEQKGTYEQKFAEFWKLACFGKNKQSSSAYKYDDSTIEFMKKYKKRLTDARQKFIDDMDYYVEKCIEMLKKNKCKVYYAKNNEEAQQIFLNELGDNKIVYKSKSNEAKEIGLVEFMEKNGIIVKETDLGDVLVQLFDYNLPTYQVGPGIHFEVEEIVEKI